MSTDDPARRLRGHCYRVGGCVRDALLSRPSQDRDWVVVGSSPEEMVQAGFVPVGKDFPVFLHPQTREEYALARTERKSAPGYHGFTFHADPDVTLEQDLARRDLTINAMAMDDDGSLIDPFQGARDLQARVLRHVSPAFAEDPVRLLRTARFAARFDTFEVHPETRQLMRQLVQGGEVDALVAERVWQELSKGLMEGHPGRMLQVLQDCGALQKLLPEVNPGERLLKVLEQCAKIQAPLAVRWACLMLDVSHENPSAQLAQHVADRLKVSTECRALADVVTREHGCIHQSDGLSAEATLRLLERCDALRRPDRFAHVLQACECDARGRLGLQDPDYAPAHRLAHALQQVLTVNTEPVVRQAQAQGLDGPALGHAVRQARILALQVL